MLLPSFLANNSAILFSKPSPAWSENGRLRGSAQARNTCGSTSSSAPLRSASCARAAPSSRPRPSAATATPTPDFRFLTLAGLLTSLATAPLIRRHAFGLVGVEGGGLWLMLGGAAARYRVLRAGAQINVDV